jgi:hypothetical protein
MKTIKNILFQASLVAVFLAMIGCNDNQFLEEHPTTFYTTDNIFSTSTQVDQVLIGIYSKIRDMWTNTSLNNTYFDFRARGTDILDITYSKRGQSFSDYGIINPDHNTFNAVYADFFDLIARANLAIYAANLPQILWASANDKSYALAQARFFRAFAYRNLGELYGGVPLVTEMITTPRYDFVRTSRLETYQYAIDEMEAIVNDFPETTAQGGRLVRGAIQHNLSELYLAKGIQLEAENQVAEAKSAYAASINYANLVINGGFYSLMNERFGSRKNDLVFYLDIHASGSITNPVVDTIQFATNHYWDLFQDGNIHYQDGNKECIWSVNIDYNAYKNEDKKSVLHYTQMYSPLMRDGATEHIYGVLEDIGGRPNSNTTLNWYVRDIIWEGKWGDDIRNSDAVFRRRFKGNVPTSPYYLKDIPWDVFYYRSTNPQTNLNNQNMCYPISCKVFTDRYEGLEEGEIRQNLFRDEYYIRLPETILLRAEAKQRNGDKAGAAADINLLRERARCGYKVTAADMDDKFAMILDERARELIYEECRWNTLLRMGGTIAVDRIREYSFWPETKATLTFNYNLWPIPQSVIDVNKDVKLEQNPGWTNR